MSCSCNSKLVHEFMIRGGSCRSPFDVNVCILHKAQANSQVPLYGVPTTNAPTYQVPSTNQRTIAYRGPSRAIARRQAYRHLAVLILASWLLAPESGSCQCHLLTKLGLLVTCCDVVTWTWTVRLGLVGLVKFELKWIQ